MRVADTLKWHVVGELPSVLIWLAAPQDALQDWLIDHLVCVRRMEHKLFLETQLRRYPGRDFEVPDFVGEFPLAYSSTVGVAGWILPNISIIDGYGLNDYIIARHAPMPREERLMAHDRYPPEGYVKSFAPNVEVGLDGVTRYGKRPAELELTAQKITDLERYWENKIVHSVSQPDSL